MNPSTVPPESVVSLHPYFTVHPGKLDAFRALFDHFIERTSSEEGCLYYDFSINGDQVFCREAYLGAAGVLAHLANVDALLKEGLTLSELTRLEVHGAATELDQLSEPIGGLNPDWFVFEKGLVKG